MRDLLAFAFALAAGACFQAAPGFSNEDPAPTNGAQEPDHADQCVLDDECELAGSSCCECPSFALPVSDGFGDACDDIDCPPDDSCPAVQAACDEGACVVQCSPIPCDTTCENGFAADGFGCLVCACAPAAPTAECGDDDDCVEVPADCCGCQLGGSDTAVPADRVAEHIDMLDCPAEPACPGVDVCMDDYTPVCVFGQCMLTSAVDTPGTPFTLCGRSDLPPCPDGEVCVLNDPEAKDVSLAGVGVCRPL